MIKKTFLPSDFRDFLSIISILGFIAIFMKFTFSRTFLSEAMEPLFLIIGGTGLMVLGKVFTINKWMKDGLQRGETLMIFAIVFGLSSFIIGIMLLFGLTIPIHLTGLVGILALAPAVFIFIDYLVKNI